MSHPHKKHSAYTKNNKVELVRGGAPYFLLLKELIDSAQNSVFIRVYIWDDDTTGTMVADALIRAAQKNVAVYVVADGYASQRLSKQFVRNLKRNGIHFRFFEPLFRSTHFYFGRRMHEKIVVVDGKTALVGGINFADRYNDVDFIPAWLDFALYISGDAATELYNYCASDWGLASPPAPASTTEIPDNPCSVRIRRNDWVKGHHEIWKTYFNMFNTAEHSITIMCSYFLPGRVLRNRLANAVKRGVKVRIILAGESDVLLAKYAERYLYTWMIDSGIEIYEYQPAVLHAKIMVADEHWLTIGSYNVNNVSAYASMELNTDVRNRPFAASVYRVMESVIDNDCIQVTKNHYLSNFGFFKRFLQKASYEIIRVILNLSTFYFRHE